jgi:hypothetical protein
LDRENKKCHDEFMKKIGTVHDFFERLELLIDTYNKHAFHNKQFTKILIKERILNVGKNENVSERGWLKSIIELIDQAKKENTFKDDIDSKIIIDIIQSVSILNIIYYLNDTIKTKKELTRQIMNVLRNAFQGILLKNDKGGS